MPRTPYKLCLTKKERDSLRYIAERYDYAAVLDTDLYKLPDGCYGLDERSAWAFEEAVEGEDGWLPLAGGKLRKKIEDLLEEIV